jgi:hypothetical protein
VTLICIFVLHIWLVKVSLTRYSISLAIWVTCIVVLWGILFSFISWKADILSTTVEILFDDYLKPAWTNIIFLFGTTNIHLRFLYLLSFLIVYKVIFSVRLSWLIDWLIYKAYYMLLRCDNLIKTYEMLLKL